MKPNPCTQISSFHGIFTPDSTKIIFAYRAWEALGEAVGSQALAIVDADGSNAQPLTYNATTAAAQTQDECPTFGAAGSGTVLFTRNVVEHSYVATLEMGSGTVTVHDDGMPEIPPGAGCPAWLGPAEPTAFMFLGCTDNSNCDFAAATAAEGGSARTRWGRSRLHAPTPGDLSAVVAKAGGGAPFGQYKVLLAERSSNRSSAGTGRAGQLGAAELMFPIYTTAAPSHIGVMETSQCDRVQGSAQLGGNASIICQGADPVSFPPRDCNPQELFLGPNKYSRL